MRELAAHWITARAYPGVKALDRTAKNYYNHRPQEAIIWQYMYNRYPRSRGVSAIKGSGFASAIKKIRPTGPQLKHKHRRLF